jgi:hypothetical protein
MKDELLGVIQPSSFILHHFVIDALPFAQLQGSDSSQA